MEPSATRTLRLALVPLLLGSVFGAAPALAGPNKDALIGLYLVPTTSPLTCSNLEPKSCVDESAVVSGNLLSYYAVLCIFGADPDSGVSGLSFGIDYNGTAQAGVDITSWTLCGDLDFPSDGWPHAREGNRITWDYDDNCQKNVPGNLVDGVTAVAGFFYLTAYSADLLKIIPHPRLDSGPELKITECPAKEISLDPIKQAGSVGFSSDGSQQGNLPCRQIAEKTWGQVKSTYGNR